MALGVSLSVYAGYPPTNLGSDSSTLLSKLVESKGTTLAYQLYLSRKDYLPRVSP
jgi:hypothetical protein